MDNNCIFLVTVSHQWGIKNAGITNKKHHHPVMGIDVQPWRTCLTGEEKDQHSLDMNGYDRYLEVSQKIAILTYLNTSSRMLTNLEVSQGLGENGENGETSNPGDFLWMTMTYHDIP
jgi:hypothetical protein